MIANNLQKRFGKTQKTFNISSNISVSPLKKIQKL
jgi:hypothetical protein